MRESECVYVCEMTGQQNMRRNKISVKSTFASFGHCGVVLFRGITHYNILGLIHTKPKDDFRGNATIFK